ncbi:hypothetical protein B7P43_G12277 [Cryptotermes secundus]|uniref:Uncharacterized protein n=1 Tax=Cryptotermes secundus TaxID=105785 RepID=A0A2J7QHK8_9NEOP|nr:hypothetical protein B7P43_G12277 [Cryptotermes secundus]
MGCYLEDYRARVGTRAARTPGRRENNGQASSYEYIGNTILCAVALAVLLVIGGVDQNPGPDSGKWDRFQTLEEKPENALQQIEELKRRNKGLEDQLRGVVAGCELGRRDTLQSA